MPRGVTLVYVRTDSSSVGVNNIVGRADLQTEGGSITVDNIGSSIAAETSGGSIDVGSAGADVKVETSGGSISIRSATKFMGESPCHHLGAPPRWCRPTPVPDYPFIPLSPFKENSVMCSASDSTFAGLKPRCAARGDCRRPFPA